MIGKTKEKINQNNISTSWKTQYREFINTKKGCKLLYAIIDIKRDIKSHVDDSTEIRYALIMYRALFTDLLI